MADKSCPPVSVIRQKAGISQSQLARALHAHPRTIAGWEQWERKFSVTGRSDRRRLVWILYLAYLRYPGGALAAELCLPPPIPGTRYCRGCQAVIDEAGRPPDDYQI